jgi:hypothetical protein
MKQPSTNPFAAFRWGGKRVAKTSRSARTLWSLIAISTLLTLSVAQGDTADARYKNLGHRIICRCNSEPAAGGAGLKGCKQVLLECSHVDCKPSKSMRRELSDALQRGESDDVILHSFAQKYGADVLEQSSVAANKLIWTVALAALTAITIAFVRRRRVRPANASTPLTELHNAESFRDRVLHETENDDSF